MAQTKQHQYDDDSQLAYFAQQDAETGRVRKVQYVNGVEQPLLNEGGASDEAHAIGYAAADAVCCVHRCHEHCVAPFCSRVLVSCRGFTPSAARHAFTDYSRRADL